jgi:hypothetical protein
MVAEILVLVLLGVCFVGYGFISLKAYKTMRDINKRG